MSGMLVRTVSGRTLIIIGVSVGVFRDVAVLHWLIGFRRLQELCDLSFGGLLEDVGDMNLDRLIWRQRYYVPSKGGHHSSHNTRNPQHLWQIGQCPCPNFPNHHFPEDDNLVFVRQRNKAKRLNRLCHCAVSLGVTKPQRRKIHVLVTAKCKARESLWKLLRIKLPLVTWQHFFSWDQFIQNHTYQTNLRMFVLHMYMGMFHGGMWLRNLKERYYMKENKTGG